MDNLRAHCNFLADPALNGRVPGAEGNRLAREYIGARLSELPLLPLFDGSWYQDYAAEASGFPVKAVNIGAVLEADADKRSNQCILVGAHYDHLEGIPGADDNASSMAIMIEAARILASRPIGERRKDILFVAFDAEERPYYLTEDMGSIYFFRHNPRPQIECGVFMDLCGHDFPLHGKEDALIVIGADSSPDLLRELPQIRAQSVSTYFVSDDYAGDKSDYYIYKKHGIPYVFLSVGWWECYHKPCDTLDRLNYDKMAGICHYLVKLIDRIQDVEIAPAKVDSLQLEARSLSSLLEVKIPADRRKIGEIVSAFSSSTFKR